MPLGSLTYHIDLAETALVVFFLAFLGAVWFLRRLDKLEGYPMKASPFDSQTSEGFPLPPDPQPYLLNEGGVTFAPHHYPQPPTSVKPLYPFAGTPLVPVGNPLLTPLGPGAWVMRRDEPMLTEEGKLMLQPLRKLPEWSVEEGEADPRGMTVFDRRWIKVGVVHDIWVDRAIKIMRLLEVELRPGLAPGDSGRVLVPIFHTEIQERAREVRVTALRGHQFADTPMPAAPDRITAREEDRLNAYFAAGRFYRGTELTDRSAGGRP
jgi:photosynthetic reaction center H subunit